MTIRVRAKNGSSISLSYLYWSWIRHVAKQEEVTLPESGSKTDSLNEAEVKELASALRSRAQKIRKGTAPRDASSFVQQVGKPWFPKSEKGESKVISADFDDPDSMDETADFFDLSGGVTLSY